MQAANLADDIGVPRMTLYRWTRANLVPAPTRYGRQAIYSPAAVAAARALAEASR